jgi:surface antigen
MRNAKWLFQSYIFVASGSGLVAERDRRRIPAWPLRLVACLLLASGLGGCSISRTPALKTPLEAARMEQPTKADGIDSTDTQLITSVVAEAETPGEPPSLRLAWSNPGTGNHGTIMAIERFVGNHGQDCKKFKTTVDNFNGISVYNGETCDVGKGSWVLSGFRRD